MPFKKWALDFRGYYLLWFFLVVFKAEFDDVLRKSMQNRLKNLRVPRCFPDVSVKVVELKGQFVFFFFSGCRLHKKSPEDHQKILQVNDNIVWGTDWYLYDHICLYLEHFRSKHRITYICICNCTRRYLYEPRSWVWVPIGMCYIQPEAPKGNCF